MIAENDGARPALEGIWTGTAGKYDQLVMKSWGRTAGRVSQLIRTVGEEGRLGSRIKLGPVGEGGRAGVASRGKGTRPVDQEGGPGQGRNGRTDGRGKHEKPVGQAGTDGTDGTDGEAC